MTLKYFNVKNGLVTGNITLDASNSNVSGNYFIGNISVTSKANLGANANVTITGGSSGQLLATDGSGNLYWAAPAGGGGIGGSNTHVQFNDSGTYGGNANFTFDKSTGVVSASHFSGEAGNLSNIQAANISGAISYATTANSVAGSNVTGAVAYATTANSVAGSNVTGAVAYATTANSVAGANVSGEVSFAATANSVAGANVSGAVGLATYATTANSVAGANVSGAVAYATTANSVAGANVSGQVSNALVAGTVYTAAQPNITSVGTLTSLDVSGGLTVGGNLTVNGTLTSINSTIVEIDDLALVLANDASTGTQANGAGIIINGASANMLYISSTNSFTFSHKISADGGLLSNITGANVTGFVANANVANTAYAVAGANVTGAVSFAITANSVAGANVTGAVAYATTANSVAGANVSGQVSFAAVANSVAVANVSGIGNIATVNLTGSSSNILYGNGVFAAPIIYNNTNVASYLESFGSNTVNTTGNITAAYFIGNGSSLTSITGANVSGAVAYATTANSVAGANVTGQVGNALVASTVYTAAQPNITSVGTLTDLAVSGISNLGPAGNVIISGGTSGQFLKTDGTGNLTWASASAGSAATITYTPAFKGALLFAAANTAMSAATWTKVSFTTVSYDTTGGALTGTASRFTIPAGVSKIKLKGQVTGSSATDQFITVFYKNGAGIGAATTVDIDSSGQDSSPSFSAVLPVAQSDYFELWAYSTLARDALNVAATWFSIEIVEGSILNTTVSTTIGMSTLSDVDVSTSSPANGQALIWSSASSKWIPSNASNLTSVGTLSNLAVTGNITSGNANLGNLVTANFFSGNGSALTAIAGANVSGAVSFATTANAVAGANVSGQVGNALVAGTVYTAAQPNITSVGTLTSLAVTGNISSGNANLGNLVTANFFSGNGHYLTDILGTQISGEVAYANKANSVAGANVTGQVSNALVAGTVYASAQPNITSVGTLTSLTVTGNITAGNVAGGNLVSANYLSGNGSAITSITGANVTGQVGNAIVAGTVYTADQPNITSTGTLTSVTVSGTSTLGAVGNVKITGGTTGQYLQTDGTGNLSWSTVTSSGGVAGSNTQVIFNDAGAYAGNAGFTFDKANTKLIANNFAVTSTANLGAVGNVIITGGSTGQVLKTDGSGGLSWGTAAGSESTVTSVDNFTGDGTTTDFTLSVTPANKNQTLVNYNGAMQLKAAYSLSGAVITFSEAPANGSLIEVITQMGVTTGAGNLTVRTFTGTGSQTDFSVSSGVNATNILVTENGVLQVPTTDYTVSSGTLSFVVAPASGVNIQVRELGTSISTITPAGSDTQVLFNDAGSFGNSSSFTFNKTSGTLTVTHLAGEGGNISNIAVANVTGLGNIALINKDGNSGNILYGNGVFASPPAAGGAGTSNARNIINSFVFGS